VRILTRALAFGVYDHGLVCAREAMPQASARAAGWPAAGSQVDSSSGAGRGVLRERLWKIRARHIVAAAGAFERPMLFPDNDRPGVMLAGAAEKFAHAFGVACGRYVVIAANGIPLTVSLSRCAPP
jgi:sarcosine oxidase subunit alpha